MNIAEADINSTEYQTLCSRIGSVFNSPTWIQVYGGGIKVFGLFDKGGKLIGFFNLYLEKRGRLITHLTNPPFSPHIALYFENPSTNPAKKISFNKSVFKLLAEFLSTLPSQVTTLTLPPHHIDMQPFIWSGYKVVPNYTYQLELRGISEQKLMAGFSPERRNDIKKAEKDGISCRQTSDFETVKKMVEHTYIRKGKQLKSRLLASILGQFGGQNSFAYVSYQNEVPLAAAFVIYDKFSAYYLLGGYDPATKHQGAGALAVSQALLHAKKLEIPVFDFEGSMLPEVERYFRGFGGGLTTLFTLNKATLPLELLLKFKNRSQF